MSFRWFSIACVSALLATAVVGCAGKDTDNTPPEKTATAVTFWNDAAPIFNNRCVTCHQEGGIAPFRLDDFKSAKAQALLVKAVVENRTMPPFLAKGDGTCGDFKDSGWLSDAEIKTLGDWATGGAVEGTARTDLHPPTLSSLSDSVEVSTPVYLPVSKGDARAQNDDYRCFVVDPKAPNTPFITGYEVVPGTPAIIHHVLVMQVDSSKLVMDGSKTNGDLIREYDGASPDVDGWPCYGLAGENIALDGIPVTWAPGMGVVNYPAGIGVQLKPTTVLVMQVHYNLTDPATRGRTDVTKVRLKMASSVERVGLFDDTDKFLQTVVTPTPASLPPGQARVPYTYEADYDRYMALFGTDSMEVHGVFPHMHTHGLDQHIEVIRAAGGANDCLADVPHWNFDWQLYYFYKQPLILNKGDKIRVTCTYDTSKRTEPLLPGWGTANEMCLTGLFLVPPKK